MKRKLTFGLSEPTWQEMSSQIGRFRREELEESAVKAVLKPLKRRLNLPELFTGQYDYSFQRIRRVLFEKLSAMPEFIGLTLIGSRTLGYAKKDSDYDMILLLDWPSADNLEEVRKEMDDRVVEALHSVNPARPRPDFRIGSIKASIDNGRLEIWPENISMAYFNRLVSENDSILFYYFWALFSPTAKPYEKILKYRKNAAKIFQKKYSGNIAEAKKVLWATSSNIAMAESLRIGDRGASRRNIVLLKNDLKDEAYDTRHKLWYRNLCKQLLGQTLPPPQPLRKPENSPG